MGGVVYMSRVTLKDIAQVCGVTPTLVSAVLNNRLGKITCVAEKKELILKTAGEMGYSPNILARSMVKKSVPVAALMFHHNDEERFFSGNGYFARRGASLTFALEKFQIESLLLFYRSEEEQIRKLESLWKKGMIGGVISNIFHNSHLEFVKCLKRLQIPHVVMGHPRGEVLGVCSSENYSFIPECHRRYGTKKAYLFQHCNGKEALFSWENIPDYVRFDHGPITASEEITADPENLIVFLGVEYLLRTKLKIAHPFVLEQESLSCLIPENCPRILYRDGDGGAGKAATLLAEWMEKGTPPPMETHRITGTEVIEKRF